ncbi:Hypothetical protein A7982_01261 [Minicystis rosea]|nr:Hypothetical protein A7982_01261 [Minicystis rosea]
MPSPSPLDDLTLARWDALTDAARDSIARALQPSLPAGFRFEGLERHACGDVAHTVAFFTGGGSRFALIPGGEVALGWDRAQRPRFTKEQLESWNETEEEYGISLDAFLDASLTPARIAVLAPFLIDTHPNILGRTPIDAPDLVAEGGNRLVFSGGSVTRVSDDGGGPRAYREEWLTRAEARAEMEAQGFMLPAQDEWEHACRAGSTTLFRWGDACPADGYPIDESAFDLHLRPNAFGLSIAQNPYEWEICEEEGVIRGGDGGSMICGGGGFLAGWLPLACAFLDSNASSWDGRKIPSPRTRRVLRLA